MPIGLVKKWRAHAHPHLVGFPMAWSKNLNQVHCLWSLHLTTQNPPTPLSLSMCTLTFLTKFTSFKYMSTMLVWYYASIYFPTMLVRLLSNNIQRIYFGGVVRLISPSLTPTPRSLSLFIQRIMSEAKVRGYSLYKNSVPSSHTPLSL